MTNVPLTSPSSLQDAEPYSWVEFFAGRGEATRVFKLAGHQSARLDILDMTAKPGKENPMDLTSDSGMATPDLQWIFREYSMSLLTGIRCHNGSQLIVKILIALQSTWTLIFPFVFA